MRAPHPRFRPQDLDYAQGLNTLKRGALPIALATVLCAAGTYGYESRLPNRYESVSTVLAAQDASQNTLINNTLVTAPPLPIGAVDQAMHSQGVVSDVTGQLNRSSLKKESVERLTRQLELEIRTQKFKLIDVTDKLDLQQRGIYEVHATGLSPDEAQVLANAAVQALLNWDTARAQTGVGRAKASLQAQVADLTSRIQTAAIGSPTRDALVSTLGQVSQNLAQIGVFEKAASGPLTLVSAANVPLLPVAPKPKRNALVAGLLALLASAGAILILHTLRRRVNTAEDLRSLNIPVLGELPRIPARQLRLGYLSASAGGVTSEAVNYLRVPLEELSSTLPQRRLVVSSARPGEGKSSVAASLSQSFARSGRRVLLIDADVHRPSQQQLWKLPSPLPADVLTVNGRSPLQLRPMPLAENIDLIPAGTPQQEPSVLGRPELRETLDRWAEGYDVVVIDTPPLLSVADALAVNRYADGLLFVIEAGQTNESEVIRALETLLTSRTTLLGFVLNKTTDQTNGYQAYSYAPADPGTPPGSGPAVRAGAVAAQQPNTRV